MMTSTPENNGAFDGVVAVYTRAEADKKDLCNLIVQYTDELLKRAIAAGITEKDEPTDIDAEYRKVMNSILPRPSKILEGISLLYMADVDRANARMRQYFEAVQKIQNVNEQLAQCYAMLKCLGVGSWMPPFMGCVTTEGKS